MRIVRLKVLLTSLALGIASGGPVRAESAEPQDHASHHAAGSFEWPGIYNGFLPCPDCAGIKTSLALNKNGSYMLMTQFAGKSDREFVEKGKFSWDDKNKTITLTPKNGGPSHVYLAGENALTQLDEHGNRITGKQAERYQLRRTDFTQQAPSHGGH